MLTGQHVIATSSRAVSPPSSSPLTTGNQVAYSAQPQAEINRKTAPHMRPRPAQVSHQVVRRSGFLEGIGQRAQTLCVQIAAGEVLFIVC
jgi:hypothetical protein